MVDTPYTDSFLRENFSQDEFERISELLQIQKKEILHIVSTQQFEVVNDDFHIMQRRHEELEKAVNFSRKQWANVVSPQVTLFDNKENR